MTEECTGISKNMSHKYFAKFLQSIAGLQSKVKERKLLDLPVSCLYFFGDVNYHLLVNSSTHLKSVMNYLLVVRLTCQQLRSAEL